MGRSKLEHQIQCAIVNYIRTVGIDVFAVPNGGSRHAYEAMNLKREGVMAGVSDLIMILPNRVVFVEVKAPKGKQQDTQKQFQKIVESMGHEYLIWRDVYDAVNWYSDNKK